MKNFNKKLILLIALATIPSLALPNGIFKTDLIADFAKSPANKTLMTRYEILASREARINAKNDNFLTTFFTSDAARAEIQAEVDAINANEAARNIRIQEAAKIAAARAAKATILKKQAKGLKTIGQLMQFASKSPDHKKAAAKYGPKLDWDCSTR